MLLGKCHKFTTPAPKDLVHYHTALDQDWVPAVAGWHRLMPEWQPWTWRQIAWHPAGDMNWGQVKCKPVDVGKLMKGVTQVVCWCGVAQQGFGAKRTERDMAEVKGKGKVGASQRGASQKMPRARESKR